MSDSIFKVIVEAGPEKGREFRIPETGCSVGRSSSNEIHIRDGEMSRMHCRFTFRDDELWVTDLASANGTLINGEAIIEEKISHGTRIVAGETILCIARDGDPIPEPPAKPIDLGLHSASSSAPTAAKSMCRNSRRMVIWSLVAALVILVSAIVTLKKAAYSETKQSLPTVSDKAEKIVEIRYEQVDGSAGNIFRYALTLNESRILSVNIDELSPARHLSRSSENPLPENRLAKLAESISATGFFDLDPVYDGDGLPGARLSYDLTFVNGLDAHRVKIVNRNEPDAFREARNLIETFARNELNLWSTEFPREKLEQLAEEAFLLGSRLIEEKDIETGNLYSAIRQFKLCLNYLETVDPKPEIFTEARVKKEEAEQELSERFADYNFRADRAINLKDWPEAATELRTILELIPDRSDKRYTDAEERLLDVEYRMKNKE